MLPTHSHIGYSDTSHAWLASLLTRISLLYLMCTFSPTFFFFFLSTCDGAAVRACVSLPSQRAVSDPPIKLILVKKYLLRVVPPFCAPWLSDKTAPLVSGQQSLVKVCGAESKITMAKRQMTAGVKPKMHHKL